LSDDAVRRQLSRIVASDGFARSDRLRRLLEFLVLAVLDGRQQALNEYNLAIEVFNRQKGHYTSDSDPIVRVQTGRLRRKLDGYYASEGKNEPVIIQVPPRSYMPVFSSTVVVPLEEVPLNVRADPVRRAAASARPVIITVVTFIGFALCLGLVWRFHRRAVEPLADFPSIVVLPFRDMSPQHDQEQFCDGLTIRLVQELAGTKGVRVVSSTSSFALKGTRRDVRDLAGELHVGLVLEGSAVRLGNKVHVTAELISAGDGFHIWTTSCDRPADDVFAIQQELARAVANTFRDIRWLRPGEHGAHSLHAYQHYLEGLHFQNKWILDSMREAIASYREAIAADPGFAPAHAELAQSYSRLGMYGEMPPAEAMQKSKAAAERALALEPALPHAHAAAGVIKALYQWDWEGAGRDFRRAHDLDPDFAGIHEPLVLWYLIATGQLGEALKEAVMAQELNPGSPRTALTLGLVHYYRRENDQAIAQFLRSLELDPQFRVAELALALSYIAKSKHRDAFAAVGRGNLAGYAGVGGESLGYLLGITGRQSEAEALLNNLLNASQSRYVSPFHLAVIYLGMGDKPRALALLARARAERSPLLAYIKVDPRFDPLRSDPQFALVADDVHPIGKSAPAVP
jgi:TolB-like protein